MAFDADFDAGFDVVGFPCVVAVVSVAFAGYVERSPCFLAVAEAGAHAGGEGSVRGAVEGGQGGDGVAFGA
ncbi:hypothetical protein [Streptomyces sp. S063]|uniref:hypothetical protein n=1 Tax=Streptomyces sp. S063 TaxID=2005885 RepID=UPI0013E38277|nr:hypothetical protein [Streptomyces sp. S063]